MKTGALITTVSIIAGILISSCEKENKVSKPIVKGLELGVGNSKVGYVGSDLHIEAEIEAEGKIDYIKIEIHHEGGHTRKNAASYMHEGEWEVDTTYSGTGITGLKSTIFHKDIDIPMHAEPGDYHFHIIVADKGGNQTTVEDEITIEELLDQ